MVEMSTSTASEAIITLTNPKVKSKHIYITNARHLLPNDVYGGSKITDPAPRLLTVTFEPGQTVQTDIPTDARTGRPRNFLRERGAIRDFLERIGAQVRDEILITRTAPYTLRISKKAP